MKDALKYYSAAHETDPVDFTVMLKLGWTYNLLHDDAEAAQWFRLARQSPDARYRARPGRRTTTLSRRSRRFQTTVWTFPFFSSRWHDVFDYSQVKTQTSWALFRCTPICLHVLSANGEPVARTPCRHRTRSIFPRIRHSSSRWA